MQEIVCVVYMQACAVVDTLSAWLNQLCVCVFVLCMYVCVCVYIYIYVYLCVRVTAQSVL